MCQTVVINRGDIELQTVRQFEDYFKTTVDQPETLNEDILMDCCLCQIDIGKELRKLNIPYKYDYSDYYVGQLDLVESDEEWSPSDAD